jgi:heme/copper-type cytochrome/quinol oxidase subunit 2
MEADRPFSAQEQRLLTVAPMAMFFVTALSSLAIILSLSALHNARPPIRVASAASAATTHLTFDILPVRPGGPADNWPAYMATSSTALPANTVVTVTIRNFDLGDDALPAGSPLLQVQGTVDGSAIADGKPYAALDADHVSHTFTISQFHLNVPIPGDPVGDATNVTVTFSFRTPAQPGSYTFQCFIPCGTGSSGFDGPMSTLGFMRGTLTVVA